MVVPENVAHGSAVAILRVQDLDSPDNAAGTLTFTITNTPQPFTLAVRSRTGNRWEVDVETVGNVSNNNTIERVGESLVCTGV